MEWIWPSDLTSPFENCTISAYSIYKSIALSPAVPLLHAILPSSLLSSDIALLLLFRIFCGHTNNTLKLSLNSFNTRYWNGSDGIGCGLLVIPLSLLSLSVAFCLLVLVAGQVAKCTK